METTFKPCYVWPGKTIPFRIYYSDDRIRIFIIENLQFNFTWMNKYKDLFKSTDYFIVANTTHYHEWLVNEASDMFEALGMNKSQFKILFNNEKEKDLFQKYGFNGKISNKYAWMADQTLYKPNNNIEKKYLAIFIGRFTESNRLDLLSEIEDLALIESNSYGLQTIEPPKNTYFSKDKISNEEIRLKINESKYAVTLSEIDMAEYSICNYLLCGIPIITTNNEGGRNFWLTDLNSITVKPDKEEIKKAIMSYSEPRINEIREDCIAKIKEQHSEFAAIIDEILRENNIHYLNTELFTKENISYKGLVWHTNPSFEYLFTK